MEQVGSPDFEPNPGSLLYNPEKESVEQTVGGGLDWLEERATVIRVNSSNDDSGPGWASVIAVLLCVIGIGWFLRGQKEPTETSPTG